MFRGDGSRVWCLFLVYFLILLDLTTGTGTQQNPSSDFINHTTVKPILRHGKTEREITTTKVSDGSHHPEVTLTVGIDGEPYVLELRLNEALVPAGHVLSYQQSGQTKLHTPGREELDICQYSGHVRGRAGSWAAVSTCDGVRGVIYDGRQMRYIEPAQDVRDNDINVDHFVYSHEHLAKEHRCGYEGGATSNSSYDPLLFRRRQEETARRRSRVSRYKRDLHEDTHVREPYNANKLSRYVELVLVVDHGEFRASGEDVRSVHRQMKDVANIINSVYAPLNIFIALVGVVIWTERDLIHVNSGENLLDKFLFYRKTELNKQILNDNAQLITQLKLQGPAIGIGTVGGMCSNAHSGGVANKHSGVIGRVAMTIAHELGHNLGMKHDTEECLCPDKQCIMAEMYSTGPHSWSSCSRKWLERAFERGKDYCLRNIPKRLFDSPTCGNGFLEEGEECDCGTGDYTQLVLCRACCRPDCTLRANATCGHGQCCDLTTCRPAAAGTECRAAQRECDLPEYCTGHSQFCPHDVHKIDATPCGNEQAYCVRGSCRSHGDQCRLLWGATGHNADPRCYTLNADGDKGKNCGYDRVRQTYRKCLPQDAACGTLQCHSLNDQLVFGDSAYTMYERYFGSVMCRSVVIDLGLSDVDPGLVPDGAKCGHNKMCLNQRCVSVESVLAGARARPGAVCPSNCSGHGVCNSEGNCHCESGFAPPLCARPGSGGSYDSGPASDVSVLKSFMMATYIIFLGIVPSVLIIYLVYSNVHWKKLFVHKLCSNSNNTRKNNRTTLNYGVEINVEASVASSSGFKRNIKSNNDGKNIEKPRKVNKEDIVIVPNTHPVVSPLNDLRPKLGVVKTNVKVPVINREINKEDIVIVQNVHPVVNTMTEHNRPKLDVIKTNKNNFKIPVVNREISKEDIVVVQNIHPVVNTMTEHNRPKLDVIKTNKNYVKVPINCKINNDDTVSVQNTYAVVSTGQNKPKLDVIKNIFENQKSIPTKQETPKPDVSVKPKVKSKPNAVPSENRPKPQVTNTGLHYTNEIVKQRANLRKVTGNLKM